MFNNRIKSEAYDRIIKKIEDGVFTSGESCRLTQYYFEGKDITHFQESEMTPELCTSLMEYGKCKLSDVPEASKTREFFMMAFTDKDVYNYIRNHITDFNRQFFKDLIATNEYAMKFDTNCFSIMPIEYIDEEMCSLAILRSTDWIDSNWFKYAYRRKPEALTADLWKLGARLYSRISGKQNRFLNMTPEEYRDAEYYKEMCSCNYNCGMELDTNKGKIMDSIPQEILTPKFLFDLILADKNNIARFSEAALETEFSNIIKGKIFFEKIWQFIVKLDGYQIKNIKLNDERIEFFLCHYDKDSEQYRWGFKDNYKRYIKQRDDVEAVAKTDETIQRNNMMLATFVLGSAMSGNPNAADVPMLSLLPINYQGIVPQELCKEYDTEEYLKMMYKTLGIQIGEEYDNLFYRSSLPEGWTIDNEDYCNYVKDNKGNTVVKYFYDSKFYDRDAYVTIMNNPKEKEQERELHQRLVKVLTHRKITPPSTQK